MSPLKPHADRHARGLPVHAGRLQQRRTRCPHEHRVTSLDRNRHVLLQLDARPREPPAHHDPTEHEQEPGRSVYQKPRSRSCVARRSNLRKTRARYTKRNSEDPGSLLLMNAVRQIRRSERRLEIGVSHMV